jgi:hypothetical protein
VLDSPRSKKKKREVKWISVWLIESSDQKKTWKQQPPTNQRSYCYENSCLYIKKENEKKKKTQTAATWNGKRPEGGRRATGLKGTDIIDSHLVKARKLSQREKRIGWAVRERDKIYNNFDLFFFFSIVWGDDSLMQINYRCTHTHIVLYICMYIYFSFSISLPPYIII